MSTKQNPGRFDCYAKLYDDEPYFVLRAKDPVAPSVVRHWANLRAAWQNMSNPKIEEARSIADQMDAWRRKHEPQATPQGDGDPRPHGLGAVERDDAEAELPDSGRPGHRW